MLNKDNFDERISVLFNLFDISLEIHEGEMCHRSSCLLCRGFFSSQVRASFFITTRGQYIQNSSTSRSTHSVHLWIFLECPYLLYHTHTPHVWKKKSYKRALLDALIEEKTWKCALKIASPVLFLHAGALFCFFHLCSSNILSPLSTV